MELAPSLRRIGSDFVNVYLIEDKGGITVIDAGMPGHWDDLVQELDVMGRDLGAVRGLILTHGDSDHLGFAERLRSETGAPVFIHSGDAPQARGEVKVKNPSWGKLKIVPLSSFLWYGVRKGAFRSTPVTEVRTVEDGEVLDLPGDPRIIHTPGHSPGSIAIHSPTADALFVGDAMTTRHVLTGIEGPQPAPFTHRPDEALASLTRWQDYEARWVLPGHGWPWDGGISEAVEQARDAASTMPSNS